MLLNERARELADVRGMLRAVTLMWDDATERATDIQLQLKEQSRLSQMPGSQGEYVQAEIVVFKKQLAEAKADVFTASRQAQERAAFLAKLRLSQVAWQDEALAGRCAICEEKVAEGELLRCTPAYPASALFACPVCSQATAL